MLAGYLFYYLHDLTGTVSFGSCASNHGAVKHVEAFNATWTCGVSSCTERGKRNHCVIVSAYKEEVDVVFVLAVVGFCLNVYAVDAVEHIEVVYIHRSGIGFHGREHICHRNSSKFHLVAVYVEVELRNFGLER